MKKEDITVSEYFNLHKTQLELDFVDIPLKGDIPVFIDPYLISIQSNNFSRLLSEYLSDFFDLVIDHIKNDQKDQALNLLKHTSENNDYHLGYSKELARGKSIGIKYQTDLLDELEKFITKDRDIITSVQDFSIFMDGIAEDRISDICSAVIKKIMLDYTANQCDLLGIPLVEANSGFYWDNDTKVWKQSRCRRLIINDKSYILVPKEIVSIKYDFNVEKYKNNYVLSFYQQDHISRRTGLVKIIKSGKNKGNYSVSKKDVEDDLIKKGEMLSKEWFHDFSLKNKEIWNKFKNHVDAQNIKFYEGSEDLGTLIPFLQQELDKIPSGNDFFTKYEQLILGISQLLFYPHLANPRKQVVTNNGNQRIDIMFSNRARGGVFKFLLDRDFPCDDIVIECKNYSKDISNPDIAQIEQRFNRNRKFGIIFTRKCLNRNLIMSKCKDAYKDKGHIILVLDDNKVKELLRIKLEEKPNVLDDYIHNLVDEIRQG